MLEQTPLPFDDPAARPPLALPEPVTPVLPSTPIPDAAIALVALGTIPGVGFQTLRVVLEQYDDDLTPFWDAPTTTLTDLLNTAKTPNPAALMTTIQTERETRWAAAQQTLQSLATRGIRLLQRHDTAFPSQLRAIPDAPFWLFVEGHLAALHHPLIAIVGTRTPSQVGIHTAERLAALVCRTGFGIVSGLAEGIDASAHRIGVYYRAPQVAVLGTGIDVVFPSSTAGLRQWIVATGGAIITEYFPAQTGNRHSFVERDRLQAALAVAVAPVEGRRKSGTAHTIRFAEQYQRPLFGVQRGTAAATNEVLTLLRSQQAPIFDLATSPQYEAFLTWLKPHVPDAQWPTHGREADGTVFFDSILQRLDAVLQDIPVSEADVAWFREQLAVRLRHHGTSAEGDAV